MRTCVELILQPSDRLHIAGGERGVQLGHLRLLLLGQRAAGFAGDGGERDDLGTAILCPRTCRSIVGDARHTVEADSPTLRQRLLLIAYPVGNLRAVRPFHVPRVVRHRLQSFVLLLQHFRLNGRVAVSVYRLRFSQDGDAGQCVAHAVVVGNGCRVHTLACELSPAAHRAAQYQTLRASLGDALSERAIRGGVVPHLLLHRLREFFQHAFGEHALGDPPGHGAGADTLAAAGEHRIEVRDAQLVGQLARTERDAARDDAAHTGKQLGTERGAFAGVVADGLVDLVDVLAGGGQSLADGPGLGAERRQSFGAGSGGFLHRGGPDSGPSGDPAGSHGRQLLNYGIHQVAGPAQVRADSRQETLGVCDFFGLLLMLRGIILADRLPHTLEPIGDGVEQRVGHAEGAQTGQTHSCLWDANEDALGEPGGGVPQRAPEETRPLRCSGLCRLV